MLRMVNKKFLFLFSNTFSCIHVILSRLTQILMSFFKSNFFLGTLVKFTFQCSSIIYIKMKNNRHQCKFVCRIFYVTKVLHIDTIKNVYDIFGT